MATMGTIDWTWTDKKITVGIDTAGNGRSVVLLPALSSISTRAEMRPLVERLASAFRVTAVDCRGSAIRRGHVQRGYETESA